MFQTTQKKTHEFGTSLSIFDSLRWAKHINVWYIYLYYIYTRLVDCLMVNLGKYTIHGSYWLDFQPPCKGSV